MRLPPDPFGWTHVPDPFSEAQAISRTTDLWLADAVTLLPLHEPRTWEGRPWEVVAFLRDAMPLVWIALPPLPLARPAPAEPPGAVAGPAEPPGAAAVGPAEPAEPAEAVGPADPLGDAP